MSEQTGNVSSKSNRRNTMVGHVFRLSFQNLRRGERNMSWTILSPLRLPFRHAGALMTYQISSGDSLDNYRTSIAPFSPRLEIHVLVITSARGVSMASPAAANRRESNRDVLTPKVVRQSPRRHDTGHRGVCTVGSSKATSRTVGLRISSETIRTV